MAWAIMGRALIGCHWGTRWSGMGIPFGAEMSPAVCVPTSIPDFYGAFSLKARAPQHSYNPVNAGSASWRNRGMLTKITRIEVGHCYLNSEKTGKKVLKDQMRHGDVV